MPSVWWSADRWFSVKTKSRCKLWQGQAVVGVLTKPTKSVSLPTMESQSSANYAEMIKSGRVSLWHYRRRAAFGVWSVYIMPL